MKLDLTGRRFGRLTVISYNSSDKYWHSKWNCKCDCGKEAVVIGDNLLKGNTKSCSCIRKELITKHGFNGSRLETVWEGMIQRCENKNSKCFKWYGGRGISICKEWRENPKAFFLWASLRWGDGLQIDRIDNDGNYEPANCRFVTPLENMRNTSRNNRKNV